MEKYTIYCTVEQTKKAFKLGAPIIQTHPYPSRFFVDKYPMRFWVSTDDNYEDVGYVLAIPTAEQMIGWLEELGLLFQTTKIGALILKEDNTVLKVCKGSRKESTLAAIDVSLDYLTNNK